MAGEAAVHFRRRRLPSSDQTLAGLPCGQVCRPIERCGRPIRPEEYHAEACGTSRIFRSVDGGQSTTLGGSVVGRWLLSLAVLPEILPPLLSAILWRLRWLRRLLPWLRRVWRLRLLRWGWGLRRM